MIDETWVTFVEVSMTRMHLPLYRFILALARLNVAPHVYWWLATDVPRALPQSVGLTRWSRPEWVISKRRIAALYVVIVHDSTWYVPHTTWYCGGYVRSIRRQRRGHLDLWSIRWYRDDDLPAIVWDDGSQFWGSDGKYHRGDGHKPAIVWEDGSMEWYCCDGTRYRRVQADKPDRDRPEY